MKRNHKIIILLIGVAALFGALRNWYFVKTGKEITVDGHQVSLLPCKSVMNELFGRGIDSVNMCKCLIPKFYELIKDDPGKIDRFKEVLKDDPEYSGRDAVYYFLGEALFLTKQEPEALPYFERLIAEFTASEYLEDARKRVQALKAQ